MLNFSPRCSRLSSTPASLRAAIEKGGVFTSLRNQTSSLSFLVKRLIPRAFLPLAYDL